MYTSPYGYEKEEVPKGYGGNAFQEDCPPREEPPCHCERACPKTPPKESGGGILGSLKHLNLSALISGDWLILLIACLLLLSNGEDGKEEDDGDLWLLLLLLFFMK